MTLWVVEATTESSEKMKSKRAVRWHDLDKGNMVGRKHLTAKRYKGIPVELELIMALRLTGPRFSRQQSQSAANCLCGILAASLCTPRESQKEERNTQNRWKQKPILLRIHFEKTRRQTNVYLSCAAGQHVTVKAETLNYPKKNEASTRLHEIRKLGANLFLTIILSPNFKNFQDMSGYTPEVHRMSGKNRAHEAHEIGSYNPRTKLMEKLLKPFY